MFETGQNIFDCAIYYIQNRIANEEYSDKQQASARWNFTFYELLFGQLIISNQVDEKIYHAFKGNIGITI